MKRSYWSKIASKKLVNYFIDYENDHQIFGNKITHYFGIPLIVVSLFNLFSHWIFLGEWGYFRIDAAVVLILMSLVSYFFMDWKIAIPFSFVLSGFYFLGRVLCHQVAWAFFFAGWILQGIGHAFYEKKSPTFLKNWIHLLIGPLWIFARAVGYHGQHEK